MIRKRVSRWALIVVIVFVGCIVVVDKILVWRNGTADTSSEAILHMHKQNSLRRRFGVPLIEKGWILAKSDSNRMYWSAKERGVTTLKPFHLSKIVFLERGTPVAEEDDFHFEGYDDVIAYRLVQIHDYIGTDSISRRSNEFIAYYLGEYPPSLKKVVTDKFADSVLHAWNSEADQPLIPN